MLKDVDIMLKSFQLKLLMENSFIYYLFIHKNRKIGLLKLRLPEDMYIFPGSFTYINCPDISDN